MACLSKRCWLQVRAGTGGEEAALWAADLMKMYEKYAELQGWKMKEVSSSEHESGGFREIVMQASSLGVTIAIILLAAAVPAVVQLSSLLP